MSATSKTRLITDLVRSATRVGAQRILGRRPRSNWTFGKQWMVELLRREMVAISTMSIPDQRRHFEERSQMVPRPEVKGVRREQREVAGLEACWFVPDNAMPGATLVYWHGGGYCVCSIATHTELISRLARASGCRTLAVNYRLAPENPYPAALDDALSVMRWLRDEGYEPHRTIVAGDSAGGNLSLASILSLQRDGEPLPAACVGISPWVDVYSERPSHRDNEASDYIGPYREAGWPEAFVGDADPKDPLVTPLYGKYDGFPPILLQVGGAEVLRDDVYELFRRMESMDVEVTYREWPEMAHVWHLMTPLVPEAKGAIAEIGAFVREHLT